MSAPSSAAREELRRRRAPALALAEGPDQALRAELLGPPDQPVERGARQVAPADVERLHDAPAVDRGPEDLELGLPQVIRDVDELELEADVRPIGAVPRKRLGVRDPGNRQLDRRPADGLEHVRQHPLVDVDHVLQPHERHLEVELREVELPVGALVLVPEAANDLVVALEAGDHQKLLEQLRRLRQGEEGARLAAPGDQEVTCPLGR